MRRHSISIPAQHRRRPNLLSVLAGLGTVTFLYGLFILDCWVTVVGGILAMLSKMWFADRMVRLYEEMKDATTEYRSWLF